MRDDDRRKSGRREADEQATDRDEGAAHPIGTGTGAAGGAAAGAVIGGVVGGPVGAAIGAAAGAVAGGFAGNELAEAINPAEEERYWREAYGDLPYAHPERGFEHHQPAFRFGWEARVRHPQRTWEEIEPELARDWSRRRGDTHLAWEDAHPAARDAWRRIDAFHARHRGRRERDKRSAGSADAAP
jgi:hypothetical protein